MPDAKSRLQELASRDLHTEIRYDVAEVGPEHDKTFTAGRGGRRPAARPRTGPFEEGGRAGRRPRGAARPRRRARPVCAPRRSTNPVRGPRCLSCPKSRRSAASSIARWSASGSRPSTSRAAARSPDCPKKQFVGRLEGAKVAGGERRGLLLTQKLDTGDLLVIDLRTGGRLRRAAAKDAVEKGTQVVITFTQGGQLRMVDGSGGLDVWVATPEELLEQVPELSDLGLDPLDEPISWTTFGRLLLERATKLKLILTDPTAVTGIGPVYSDEILHGAGLRHDRESHELSSQEMRRLYRALVETLHEAAKRRGSTLADGALRRPVGQARRLPGRAQGVRARRPGLQALPRASSPRPSSAARSCTTAPSARSDMGLRERAVVGTAIDGLVVITAQAGRRRAGHRSASTTGPRTSRGARGSRST